MRLASNVHHDSEPRRETLPLRCSTAPLRAWRTREPSFASLRSAYTTLCTSTGLRSFTWETLAGAVASSSRLGFLLTKDVG